jgi:DNA-binding response OmpR family regulator/archaellum component FlaC
MSKTVLLIESDPTFARGMSAALEARGFAVRTSSDGKEGVELVRALRPDCVVLCVELPGLSGYSWCNRLKKDDALKRIPLVITSSEATPETFEQHRKLKTRAEDYLIKPFPPATLVERIGALVGMPEAPAADEEEMITLADVELDGPAGAAVPEEDADLKMLDAAFDSISGGGGADEPSTRAPGAPMVETPLTLLPDADESPAVLDLDREMAAALASLAEEGSDPGRKAPIVPSPPPTPVRLVEPTVEPSTEVEETPILLEDVEVLPTVDVTDESSAVTLLASREEVRALREEADRLRSAAADRESDVAARDADLAETRGRLESIEGSVRRLETELEGAREASRLAEQRASELDRELLALRPRLEEAEHSASSRGAEAVEAGHRAGALERTLEEARAESTAAREGAETVRAEADSLRKEVETVRAEADSLRKEVETLRAEADSLRKEVETVRAEADSLRKEVETVRAEADAHRKDVETVRAEADAHRKDVETFRAEAHAHRTEAEMFRSDGVDLRAAGEALRAEVASLRAAAESQGAEAAAFRAEAEGRTAELTRRLQEAEAQAAQHEDRVLRAHQKIKSDEKLREKTRKALAMVLQVLEERSAGDGTTPPATPER